MKLYATGEITLSAKEAEAVRKLIADTTDEDRAASGLDEEEVCMCGEIYDELTQAREAVADRADFAAMQREELEEANS